MAGTSLSMEPSWKRACCDSTTTSSRPPTRPPDIVRRGHRSGLYYLSVERDNEKGEGMIFSDLAGSSTPSILARFAAARSGALITMRRMARTSRMCSRHAGTLLSRLFACRSLTDGHAELMPEGRRHAIDSSTERRSKATSSLRRHGSRFKERLAPAFLRQGRHCIPKSMGKLVAERAPLGERVERQYARLIRRRKVQQVSTLVRLYGKVA